MLSFLFGVNVNVFFAFFVFVNMSYLSSLSFCHFCHCQSLSVILGIVGHCWSLLVIVGNFLLSSVIVGHCQSLSVIVGHCHSLSFVKRWLSVWVSNTPTELFWKGKKLNKTLVNHRWMESFKKKVCVPTDSNKHHIIFQCCVLSYFMTLFLQ